MRLGLVLGCFVVGCGVASESDPATEQAAALDSRDGGSEEVSPCTDVNKDKTYGPSRCQQLDLEGVCKFVLTGGTHFDWWKCVDEPTPHKPECESISGIGGVVDDHQAAEKMKVCTARPDCHWQLVVAGRSAVYRCLPKP